MYTTHELFRSCNAYIFSIFSHLIGFSVFAVAEAGYHTVSESIKHRMSVQTTCLIGLNSFFVRRISTISIICFHHILGIRMPSGFFRLIHSALFFY